MRRIPAVKMNGCGNDFILVDNRDQKLQGINLRQLIRKVCARRLSIGADGFILLESSTSAHYKMRYFNADGSEGEMCGNGARCTARYAYMLGLAPRFFSFETRAGIYRGEIKDDGKLVEVSFPDIKLVDIRLDQKGTFGGDQYQYHYLWVGVPHVVLFVGDWVKDEDKDIIALGKIVRRAESFSPLGTNVNFVHTGNGGQIYIRTYERGVEDETLACGTGATASAIITAMKSLLLPPIEVRTRAGLLKISFQIHQDKVIEITMEGEAKLVAQGYLLQDAWDY